MDRALFFVGMPLLCFGFDGYCRVRALWSGGEGRRGRAWPIAREQITAPGLEEHEGSGDTPARSVPRVRYRYTVDDQVYHGTRIAFDAVASVDPTVARQLIERYPEGAAVTVHDNPRDPESAVLEPRTSRIALLLTLGTTTVAAGLAIGLWGLYGNPP